MAVNIVNNNFEEVLESETFKKGLKEAEHVVQYINKKYISLDDKDYTTYADYLQTVLTNLIPIMKDNDPLFRALYQKEHFAGSYADGLKIGKPTEYDMNLIIKLPLDQSKLEFEDATPSFVKIKTPGLTALKEPGSSIPPEFVNLVDKDGYILQTKFRDWMESVLTKAFNTLPEAKTQEGNTRTLFIPKSTQEYKIRYKKSGPALTLKVSTPDGCSLDVDLVPSFQFGPDIWPKTVKPRPRDAKKKHWMVVPKPKKLKEGEKLGPDEAREWRMSFLDQEKEMLLGKGTVKPTIKLLKKLRDVTPLPKLSSYAIKTVILFELEKQNEDFWKNRLVYIFLWMLNRLISYIKEGHIPFYWDERDDLLKLGGKLQCENAVGRLTKILKEMIRNVETNPYIIAEKLLSAEEYNHVKLNCAVPIGSEVKGCRNVTIPYMANAMRSNSVSQSDSSQSALENIYQKLDEIQKGQERFSQQVLRAIAMIAANAGKKMGTEVINHDKCDENHTNFENRISSLEDCVSLMKKEIQMLKNERLASM